VRATDAYGDLMRMGRTVVTTREAAVRWRTEVVTAARRLRAMEKAGLVLRLRRGLWSLDRDVEPFVVAPFLTTPFPAYVSLWSALAHHGLIEQIPRQVSVASLDRPRRVETSIATYDVHHLAPEVFGGFAGSERTGYVAAAEKAIFDIVYVRAAAGGEAYFPELSLPRDFDPAALDGWIGRIASGRLRTIVLRRARQVLRNASVD
jgi:predicted transcriptional regulator of viral defense system